MKNNKTVSKESVISIKSDKLELVGKTKIDFYQNYENNPSKPKRVKFSEEVSVHNIPNNGDGCFVSENQINSNFNLVYNKLTRRQKRKMKREQKKEQNNSKTDANNSNEKENKKNLPSISKKHYTVFKDNLFIKIDKKSLLDKKAKCTKSRMYDKFNVILKYNNEEDMNKDMFNMGIIKTTETKIIVNNLSFKETEESLYDYFTQFECNEIVKVSVDTNKHGKCTGKAVVTVNNFGFNKKYILNKRRLRIEKLKVYK